MNASVDAKENAKQEMMDAVFAKMPELGYVWLFSKTSAYFRDGKETFYQLGNPNQRAIFSCNGRHSSVSIERYEDTEGWTKRTNLSVDRLFGEDLPPGVLENSSDILRKLAVKFSNNMRDGYYFEDGPRYGGAPEPNSDQQILGACISSHPDFGFYRVRLIHHEDDPILIFEKRKSDDRWVHLHRTTASRYLGPDYRRDVVITTIPETPEVRLGPSAPDYHGSRLGRVGEMLHK